MCNSNGQTLLHSACLLGEKEVAQKVLEAGIDKDKLDNSDHTALFYAAKGGYADTVELLMKYNVDGNKTDERLIVEEDDASEDFGGLAARGRWRVLWRRRGGGLFGTCGWIEGHVDGCREPDVLGEFVSRARY